jgi:hypothetical protein
MRSVSLIFVSSSQFFELARPISAKVVHIGGIADQPLLIKGKEQVEEKKTTIVDLDSVRKNQF